MGVILVKLGNLVGSVLDSLADIFRANRAEKLLVAAFVVATLRQMGVNGHFIGYDPATGWPWFQPLEVWSGVAMAMLEGIALAYIAKRWRRLSPKGWADWSYWSILLLGQLVMLVSIIFYVSLYAFAAQRGETVAQVFTPEANMAWNVAVALVNPLIAILIGIVDDGEQNVATEEQEAVLALWAMMGEGLDVDVISPTLLAAKAHVPERVAAQVLDRAYSKKMLVG